MSPGNAAALADHGVRQDRPIFVGIRFLARTVAFETCLGTSALDLVFVEIEMSMMPASSAAYAPRGPTAGSPPPQAADQWELGVF